MNTLVCFMCIAVAGHVVFAGDETKPETSTPASPPPAQSETKPNGHQPVLGGLFGGWIKQMEQDAAKKASEWAMNSVINEVKKDPLKAAGQIGGFAMEFIKNAAKNDNGPASAPVPAQSGPSAIRELQLESDHSKIRELQIE
ncbi:uncharacterized protein LOC141858445 [Brevipalpus obovatus]|uniref:uncharacterized protein LOC141858445 n=1 Tax=Brevipalpus obovatus TaxID=246614 RepID=UPI003D9E8803